MSLQGLTGKVEFCMNRLEEAREMLKMALKDLRALEVMLDPDSVDVGIFGFHAQQAVEKSLKAWITALGMEHTYKHDLRQLLIILRELGCDVTDLWEFVDLNTFAVQFRYEDYADTDAPLDRQDTIRRVKALYAKVRAIIEETEKKD